MASIDPVMPTKKIVVVEDDPRMQQMLTDYLQRNDMVVRVAEHGRDLTRLLA